MVSGNQRKFSGGRLSIPPALRDQVGMREGSIVKVTVSGTQLILQVMGYEEPKKREES